VGRVLEGCKPQGFHRVRQLGLVEDADRPAVRLDPDAAHVFSVDQHRDFQSAGPISRRRGIILPQSGAESQNETMFDLDEPTMTPRRNT
jgi:hypothetical protein